MKLNTQTIRKHVLIMFFLLVGCAVFAQDKLAAGKHKYYLELTGIRSKEDVEVIEKLIQSKPGIERCTSNDYPVAYFVIVSTGNLTETECSNWLAGTPYALKQMEGNGSARAEQMLYQMKKKRQGS